MAIVVWRNTSYGRNWPFVHRDGDSCANLAEMQLNELAIYPCDEMN